jgi:hypothetical protein
MWEGSGHADASAEAFRHWDEDDPVEVPTRCANCHSSYGYRDFLGADGSEAGVVDMAAAVDSTVDCVACHNAATMVLDSVVFPSGAEITGLGDDARCMQCHQGRASTVSVDTAVEELGLGDDDISTGEEALGFVNVHYFAAAATRYGTFAMGGYQYADKTYDGFFAHVEEFDNCNECHDPHTLEVQAESCYCHDGVATVEDLRNERMYSSPADYDGDGDATEGVYYEIMGLTEVLYAAMQEYSAGAGGTIVYDSSSYPYFFDEAGERYAAWTPRLLRAAYNYQYAAKDPGAYAHGGKYVIQLLYDSIEDLGADVTGLHRADPGHFDGSAEAWRHWDEDGEVSGRCARCHSADGLEFYLENGSNIATEIANGMQCVTCHDHEEFPALHAADDATFPSGMSATFGEAVASNLCLQCHQGRESGAGVAEELEGYALDTVSEDVGFSNVHYYVAGATLFGSEVAGGYEYAGQTYAGVTAHPVAECVECHDPHMLVPDISSCACHAGAESFEEIRIATTDFDGDGDTDEGIAGEIETMHEALYAAIQANATANADAADIVYNSGRYPYWFTADGERYATWTPRLARAAYNYQFAAKDPGGFTHNATYVIQLLYDTLNDLGAAGGMTRP